MTISFPELTLVLLIGPSGSGKSTFARRHFRPSEVISSDACRLMVADDEADQASTPDAFEVLRAIAAKRLARGRFTVIDATNVRREDREPLIALAREHHFFLGAIVFDLPVGVCSERNQQREGRRVGREAIARQSQLLRKSLRHLKNEGFRYSTVFDSPEQAEAAMVERTKLWNDRRDESVPFDIIGDVHGCADELGELLADLGYQEGRAATDVPGWTDVVFTHPEGRKALFVGDLTDRGPKILESVGIVRNMIRAGAALCVPGNHDVKLVRHLSGKPVKVNHGFAETLAEIEAVPVDVRPVFTRSLREFLDGLISHYVLDGGKLVVAHAGLKAEMHGRGSARVRDFALFGETTGETDEFGLPVRYQWAADYRGAATVVYGHTPIVAPEWLNNTVNVDTGCVFGGRLTALRYPEREFVSVPARRVYCEPIRPIAPPAEAGDELLDLADFSGKIVIETRLQGRVTIPAANTADALETMSRFALDPRWLIYIPPTMSPPEASRRPDYLEHPAEAFAYYRKAGISRLVCQEKHMGSRAVAVVGRDPEAIRKAFGIKSEHAGTVYTRTGRKFFDDAATEKAFLDALREAVAKLWEELGTDWLALDGELLPWSAKAQELLRTQYAATGAAARSAYASALAILAPAAGRLEAAESARLAVSLSRLERGRDDAADFSAAYRRYCWPVASVADLRFAPFHLLASNGAAQFGRPHSWHMSYADRLAEFSPNLLRATRTIEVDLADENLVAAGVSWWEELTSSGGEGMVVKPAEFVVRGKKGLAQPGVKCRGREYLRLIYGPEYLSPENLERLRVRAVSGKRSLALREFALGIEGVERFVRGEALRRVHECALGVIALEAEPIDPRL